MLRFMPRLTKMVTEEEPLMNRKKTLSNVPTKLYCHTKVILSPSKTEDGFGGVTVNVGFNSTKQNNKII